MEHRVIHLLYICFAYQILRVRQDILYFRVGTSDNLIKQVIAFQEFITVLVTGKCVCYGDDITFNIFPVGTCPLICRNTGQKLIKNGLT